MHHTLKIHPPYYDAKVVGNKPWEMRRTEDRTFIVGDTVAFQEWDPINEDFTGRPDLGPFRITYVLPLEGEGTCVFTHTDYPDAQVKDLRTRLHNVLEQNSRALGAILQRDQEAAEMAAQMLEVEEATHNRQVWLDTAKRQAHADLTESFDTVWARTLERSLALAEAEEVNKIRGERINVLTKENSRLQERCEILARAGAETEGKLIQARADLAGGRGLHRHTFLESLTWAREAVRQATTTCKGVGFVFGTDEAAVIRDIAAGGRELLQHVKNSRL